MSVRTSRLTALQHRDFRLLWFGQLVSTLGSQMSFVAINWHLYTMLKGQTWAISLMGRTMEIDLGALGLGLGGLVRVIPIMAFALLGGVLADIIPRRKLMIIADVISALVAISLTLLTFFGLDQINYIYLLTAVAAAASAVSTPARQALVPNLVPREHLANAVSLNTVLFQIGTIVGPGLAGFLISKTELWVVYGVDSLTFIAVITALVLMRHRGGPAAADGRLNLAMMREGLSFTFSNRILFGTMLLDFFATLFGSARTMLPIIAEEILKVGVQGYGWLAAAQPVGAMIAGVFVSLRPEIRRQGIVLLVGVAVYGLATALFGWSTWFWASFIFFALTGAGDTVSTVIRGTIRQVVTPDHLRGRATSVSMVFFMGGPQLGELEAGIVASLLGVPFAIISGGIATILMTGFVAWRYPRLRRYTPDQLT